MEDASLRLTAGPQGKYGSQFALAGNSDCVCVTAHEQIYHCVEAHIINTSNNYYMQCLLAPAQVGLLRSSPSLLSDEPYLGTRILTVL